ncbi:17861_t:CDS:1, partial [Racocetra fulgida]
YILHYSDLSVAKNLEVLQNWPSDDNIKVAIHYAYEQATALAKDILDMVINAQVCGFITVSKDEEVDPEVANKIDKQLDNLQRSDSLQETENICIFAAAVEVNMWNKLNALTE